MKTTPEQITDLAPHQVFVFGSNRGGYHGGGAAKQALDQFGARWGCGEGLMGQSYALPTKGSHLETLALSEIEKHVVAFLWFAGSRPELEFLVTKIGCGLAAYTPNEIKTCFAGKLIPSNVVLPEEFL